MIGTLAIIQARMSSSRLPGKVLKDICGEPMLKRVIERVGMAKQVEDIVVATTTDPSDDILAKWCLENRVDSFRGSMQDVLDRFYVAAQEYKPNYVARITADCPVIDPELIDETIHVCVEKGVDFAATRLPPPFRRTYPIGLDVEVSTYSALERNWREANTKFEREHVYPYLYEVEGRFKIHILNTPKDYGSLRWTVDTAEDLVLIQKIYAHFLPRTDFKWMEILELLEKQPELTQINVATPHKSYLDVDERGGGE
jgi:spore coat polysaccharide biosynthesis protein SpsF